MLPRNPKHKRPVLHVLTRIKETPIIVINGFRRVMGRTRPLNKRGQP